MAVLGAISEGGLEATVLRVPVLYGPAPQNSDTAVNILVDVVEDQSGKVYKMDHYATRFPTNVVDIANFLVRLSCKHLSSVSIVHLLTLSSPSLHPMIRWYINASPFSNPSPDHPLLLPRTIHEIRNVSCLRQASLTSSFSHRP